MPLKCTCPRCGKLHRNIDKQWLGRKYRCDCGKVMRLGVPSAADPKVDRSLPKPHIPAPSSSRTPLPTSREKADAAASTTQRVPSDVSRNATGQSAVTPTETPKGTDFSTLELSNLPSESPPAKASHPGHVVSDFSDVEEVIAAFEGDADASVREDLWCPVGDWPEGLAGDALSDLSGNSGGFAASLDAPQTAPSSHPLAPATAETHSVAGWLPWVGRQIVRICRVPINALQAAYQRWQGND